jgi:quinol monooxygenase YgiN
MYIQQVEVQVEPERLELWDAHVRNYLAVSARQPGGVWFRTLRFVDDPYRFLHIRAWLTREDHQRSWDSLEMDMAGRFARENPLYGGRPIFRSDFELMDMVWGPKGPGVYPSEGRYVHHITGRVGAGKYAQWRPYSRTLFGVMARQPGIASFEIMRPGTDLEGFLVLRSFLSEDDQHYGPGPEASVEVQYATEPVRTYDLYAGAEPAVVRKCTLHDMVWGLEGARACQEFMEGLQPI